MPIIYGLSVETPYLEESKILVAFKSQTRDYWRDIVAGLSYLQISLLLSIKNLLDQDIFSFNFEVVYREYKNLFSRNHSETFEKAPKSLALKVHTRTQ